MGGYSSSLVANLKSINFLEAEIAFYLLNCLLAWAFSSLPQFYLTTAIAVSL